MESREEDSFDADHVAFRDLTVGIPELHSRNKILYVMTPLKPTPKCLIGSRCEWRMEYHVENPSHQSVS
jgi:hypothetical protein